MTSIEGKLEAWYEITNLIKKTQKRGIHLKKLIDFKVELYYSLFNEKYDSKKKPNKNSGEWIG